MITLRVPVRTVSEANRHEHWRVRHKRSKDQHWAVMAAWNNADVDGQGVPKLPIRVTLTRVSPRKLDSDNLAMSCKHVRDAVAKMLGIDDGDPGVTWVYQQEKGLGPGRYEVVIQVEEAK